MVTLGLDPHPGSHTVVALDRNGTFLANFTVPNTPARRLSEQLKANRSALQELTATSPVHEVLQQVMKTLRKQLTP